MVQLICQIAVNTPLRQLFDYFPPPHSTAAQLQPGIRISVPFGKQKAAIGILIDVASTSRYKLSKIKTAHAIIDSTPLFTPTLLKLCQWASDYYHYPIGETLMTALPALLRRGQPAQPIAKPQQHLLSLTTLGIDALAQGIKRAHKQRQLLSHIAESGPQTQSTLNQQGYSSAVIKASIDKQWLEQSIYSNNSELPTPTTSALQCYPAQQNAIEAIKKSQGFEVFLLAGITGSGKTEVYLQAIAHVLAQGQQALMLVPEINLTPQTVERFQQRFQAPISIIHSDLTPTERLNAWLDAKSSRSAIIIGTRSAVFTATTRLGIIIIDEEHDGSFKQQSGLRYSARDLAIMRARLANIPIILGSATPSSESYYNACRSRYHLLQLNRRAGSAHLPHLQLVDCRQQPLTSGLSPVLLAKIQSELSAGHQVLLFLNRRGYAPTMICHACGWIIECPHCDARLTWHQQRQRLICHHCEFQQPLPTSCPQCHQSELMPVGQGTERIATTLTELLPNIKLLRFDRDTVQSRSQLLNHLAKIHTQDAQLLIGTQMLAKGHHFPNLTLVAVIDADSGLLSHDFRGTERMTQLITQVAGRAGRETQPGTVMIQTHYPDHPVLKLILEGNYLKTLHALMNERRQADLPPFTFMAILRAEAKQQAQATNFLNQAKLALKNKPNSCQLIGPLPAIMERKGGRFRSQLILQAHNRTDLHLNLKRMVNNIANFTKKHTVRWSVDVDPNDNF